MPNVWSKATPQGRRMHGCPEKLPTHFSHWWIPKVFFSIGITFGIITAYGSHWKRDEPVFVNSCVVALCDGLFSFVAGFTVFATLDHWSLGIPLKPRRDFKPQDFRIWSYLWFVVRNTWHSARWRSLDCTSNLCDIIPSGRWFWLFVFGRIPYNTVSLKKVVSLVKWGHPGHVQPRHWVWS